MTSGVIQMLVLCPLLFVSYINNVDDSVVNIVREFAEYGNNTIIVQSHSGRAW